MKDGIKLKGKLATYMRWPFILAILLVAMDVLLYSVSWKAGGIGTVFTAVYLLLGILLYFHRRPLIRLSGLPSSLQMIFTISMFFISL